MAPPPGIYAAGLYAGDNHPPAGGIGAVDTFGTTYGRSGYSNAYCNF